MKPFNLQAALRGEPVVTRDGQRATDFKAIPQHDRYIYDPYSYQALIGTVMHAFTANGRYVGNGTEQSLDLFMADEGGSTYPSHGPMYKAVHDAQPSLRDQFALALAPAVYEEAMRYLNEIGLYEGWKQKTAAKIWAMADEILKARGKS